ncbi:hypothetical protein TrVGV298_004078 [Trichoderma virens]|nr:hypothetical protein TrVGV298_004078 [Trichoderma virens]
MHPSVNGKSSAERLRAKDTVWKLVIVRKPQGLAPDRDADCLTQGCQWRKRDAHLIGSHAQADDGFGILGALDHMTGGDGGQGTSHAAEQGSCGHKASAVEARRVLATTMYMSLTLDGSPLFWNRANCKYYTVLRTGHQVDGSGACQCLISLPGTDDKPAATLQRQQD